MLIKDLLQLKAGSVVEVEKLAGESLDVMINDKVIARGEAVVVNEKFGFDSQRLCPHSNGSSN